MTDVWKQIKTDIQNWYKGVLVAILYLVVTKALWGRVCPMVLLTGLPCPACGLTRAGIAFLCLDWEQAWHFNACIFLIIPVIIYYLVCHYFASGKCRGGSLFLCIIVFSLIALYLYRMVYLFPDSAPMEYYTPNLFSYFKNQ